MRLYIKLKCNTRIEDEPWIGRTLKNCIRRKMRCLKYSYIRNVLMQNINIRNTKNKLISTLRSEEIKYYNDQLRLKTKDIKGTWSVLNKVVSNKNKANNHQPVSLEINGFNYN